MHLKTMQPKRKLRANVSFHSRAPSRPGWSTRTPSRRHASSTTGASPIRHGRLDQKGGGAAQGPSLTSCTPEGGWCCWERSWQVRFVANPRRRPSPEPFLTNPREVLSRAARIRNRSGSSSSHQGAGDILEILKIHSRKYLSILRK